MKIGFIPLSPRIAKSWRSWNSRKSWILSWWKTISKKTRYFEDHQKRDQGQKHKGKGNCHPARAVVRTALQRILSTRKLHLDRRELGCSKYLAAYNLNRLHHNQHGWDQMFAAAKDVWIPLMHRNLSATAKFCKHCLETGKNFKPDKPKGDIGTTYKPKEPNDLVQLDLGPRYIDK